MSGLSPTSPTDTDNSPPLTESEDRLDGVSADVARQAVTWLVELQSARSGSDIERAILDWRARDPAHERAWQRIEAVNARLGGLASPLGSALAQAALTRPASRGRRQAVKLLAAALFVGGATLATHDHVPWRPWLADARSRTGERRTLQLADGSRVLLNSNSAVNIAFSDHARRLQLVRGEILIDTGRDEAFAKPRPFQVATPHGVLQPLGTRFSVRLYDDRTRLDVFAGAVEIHPAQAAAPSLTVNAGNSAEFAGHTILASGTADNDRIAWQDGMIVATRMRLADFLAELDRHRPGRLNCDPAVAALRLLGSYPLAEPDRILDALRSTLPVEIHYVTRYWATVRAARRG